MNINKLDFMPTLPSPGSSPFGDAAYRYQANQANIISNMQPPGQRNRTTSTAWGQREDDDIFGEILGLGTGTLSGLARNGAFDSFFGGGGASPANAYSAAQGFGVGDVLGNVNF
jgi:hypothetical protein